MTEDEKDGGTTDRKGLLVGQKVVKHGFYLVENSPEPECLLLTT